MPIALLSVYDKTGLVAFASALDRLGWKLLASGGTARALDEAGLTVQEVAEYTNSPEILGGRVKTLHPAVHGGILARDEAGDRSDLLRIGAQYIDMVVVNLYPFEQTVSRPDATLADAVENIDIGGVALIRAAAKNFERVTIVVDPSDYDSLLSELSTGPSLPATRRRLAFKGFARTAAYDQAISTYLGGPDEGPLYLTGYPVQTLRYGENPHQTARLYSWEKGTGPLGGRVLQGKELSYNNLLDLDAAWKAAVSFDSPTICIVKHLSPCGIASAQSLAEAYLAAFACDKVSAFGGVIASNRPFDGAVAAALGDLFAECIAAPGFTAEARDILTKKKNCRLLELPDLAVGPAYELRSLNHGLLRQDLDLGDPPDSEWRVISRRDPSESEWRALRFAWKACQHVKSNAIVFAQGQATVGIGGGQPNRVDCVRLAAERAGDKAHGAVMASDAFFPFPDSVEAAVKAGVTAIIHPGGSVRDAESLAAADSAGAAMVVTGVRHFRH